MAIYRMIHTTFWTDTKIIDDFTPEDKYFMLYCLTNSYTNLCGCYEISIKQMERDLGYNEETIKNLLKRFKEIHKIIFYDDNTKELFIKNWSKYNWTKSQKLDKPLLEEIKKIKTVDFKGFLAEEYNKRDTVSIPYIYPMHTTDTVSVSVTDTINNNIYNINNKKIIKTFEENIGTITPASAEILFSYLDDFDVEVIVRAIKEASLNNKRSAKYIQGILNQWQKKGIKTLLDVEENEKEFKEKTATKEKKTKQTSKAEYEQRQYDKLDFLYANKGG